MAWIPAFTIFFRNRLRGFRRRGNNSHVDVHCPASGIRHSNDKTGLPWTHSPTFRGSLSKAATTSSPKREKLSWAENCGSQVTRTDQKRLIRIVPAEQTLNRYQQLGHGIAHFLFPDDFRKFKILTYLHRNIAQVPTDGAAGNYGDPPAPEARPGRSGIAAAFADSPREPTVLSFLS
jgi:hypothetical protein